jgi:hypothetical protein
MPLPTQKPTKKQLLYGKFSPDLYRLTGGEETDSLLDVIDADMSATNAGSVQTSASDIGGGGSSANTTVVANGSVEAGKTSFDNTVAGYILGVDPTNGAAKFYIGNTSSYLNWDGATLTIVGGVAISQLNIPDLVTANSFHVDSSGNAWWGATTIGSATAKVLDTGVATFSNANITGGSVATSTLNVAVMGWTTDIVFSSASATQVNWTSGHIVVTSGTTYTISSGNTGTMSALTYIYLDTAVSTTVLQTTTTYSAATGASCILIATAQNNTVGASVIPYGGSPPIVDGSQVTASSITAGQIAASTITAAQMNVSSLSAISANLGSITSGSITVVSGSDTVAITPGSTNAIISGPTGSPTFILTTAGALTATSATVNGTILSNQDAFGDGSDGPATISGDTTLTRDMFYMNLTINSTKHLYTASFRVFVNGTLTNNGTIDNSGNAASGSTGGAAIASGSLVGTVAGGNGGGGGLGNNGVYNGAVGSTGPASAKSIGSAGSAGGGGGTAYTGEYGTGGAGGAGSAGSQTGTVFNKPHTFTSAYNLFDAEPSGSFAVFNLASGGGGGGGGGASAGSYYGSGSGSGTGGSGGGAGSPGGLVWISARQLVNNGVISTQGGAGANGGNGSVSVSGGTASAGGGGGGAGGAGGVIIMIYSQLTGSGSVNVAAGAGGSGGTGAGGGTGSSVGVTGTAAGTSNAGTQISLQI